MAGRQPGFWDVEERLRELSAQGDPLEKLGATVDFEIFRGELDAALGPRDRSKGGRPPFDPVLNFRMLVLQAMHGLSLAQTEFLVADRLSWMRFCGLGPDDAVPDASTVWDFREALIMAAALDALFARLDRAIAEAGYLPMSGQVVDATLAAAPPAQHGRGEGEHQVGRNRRRDLARQARQGPAERHRRTPDDEAFQGEARRPRRASDRHRDPRLRLQVAHLERPAARHHPPGEGHGRRRA